MVSDPWPRRSDPVCLGLGDLQQYCVLEAALLIVEAEGTDRSTVSSALADDGDDQAGFVDDATVWGLPTACSFDDGVA